jgi:hydrogenase maturation protease
MMISSDDARNQPPGIIKIIGIGQSMRGDDAAGLAAVQHWQTAYPEHAGIINVEVQLAEMPGIGLLNLLEGAEVAILVDAVRSGAEAGTIHLLSEDQLESFTSAMGSAHGWGVAETLSLGRRLMPSTLPAKLILIGIEAADVSIGTSLSPGVQQALPEVARMIEQLAGES